MKRVNGAGTLPANGKNTLTGNGKASPVNGKDPIPVNGYGTLPTSGNITVNQTSESGTVKRRSGILKNRKSVIEPDGEICPPPESFDTVESSGNTNLPDVLPTRTADAVQPHEHQTNF